MPHYSPELVESVLHAHEYTDKPLKQIAAENGIGVRDITRIRHANGVPSRRARVRELPEEMREAHDITKRLKAAAPPADGGRTTRGDPSSPRLRRARSQSAEASAKAEAEHIAPQDVDGAMRCAYCALRTESESAPPALDGPAPSIVPSPSGDGEHDLRALIARVIRLVERELAAEENRRAQLGLHPRTPAELERCARIVASMIRSLREAVRLRAVLAPEQSPLDHDLPEDADDIRNELARRIEALLASWEAGGSADGAA